MTEHRRSVFNAGQIRVAILIACAFVLAACGGGGSSGGGTTPPPPPPPPTGGTSTVVSGKATFDLVPHNAANGLNYAATVEVPIRGAVAQLLSAAGAVLAETVTDANGDYTFAAVDSGQSARVRVRAEMRQTGTPSWDFSVIDNTSGGALYVLDSASFTTSGDTQTLDVHADSGWTGSAYTQTRAAGPFAILGAVYEAYNKILTVAPATQFPPLTLNWSVNNRPASGNESDGDISTSFYRRSGGGQSEIFLLGAANQDTDEYDDHVVIHEWGHYFEDRLARSDSVGGPHGEGDRLDMRVAFSEGFGYAFAGMVTDDPNSRDSGGFDQAAGFNINVELNTNQNPGWYSEGSVQSILYDLYDSDSDGVDTLSIGLAPLFDVITGAYSDTVAFTSVFSFITSLKAARPDLAAGIDQIVAAQNIATAGMDVYGSTAVNNAGNADVLPIYTVLPTDGSSVEVCSIGGPESANGPFGTYNKLSNRRYLRFTITTAGDYRIDVSGAPGSDADVLLYQRDFLAIAQAVGNDTLIRNLAPGDYVLEVYEAGNVFPPNGDQSAAGRTCIDVSLQPV